MYFWTEWVSIDLFLTICVLNLFLLLVTYFGGNKRHSWWFDMKIIQLCLFSFVPAKRCGYFWVYYWLHLCWLFYVFLFTMEVLCDMPAWMSWYFVKFIRHTDTLSLNPFQPNISIHILYTVLCTSLMILTSLENFSIIRSFLPLWSFPLFSWPLYFNQGWYCEEKWDWASRS